MSYNQISNIKENEESQAIEIRVIKKWTPPQQTTEFCYLFVDVNVSRVYILTYHNE